MIVLIAAIIVVVKVLLEQKQISDADRYASQVVNIRKN